MAERSSLPAGFPTDGKLHTLTFGDSFSAGSRSAFHTIRYDFKPASVDTTKMSTVDMGENNSLTVQVPHVEGSGTSHTVYKGNKRPAQKECVFIVNPVTGELKLEKISNHLQLKKTSNLSSMNRKRKSDSSTQTDNKKRCPLKNSIDLTDESEITSTTTIIDKKSTRKSKTLAFMTFVKGIREEIKGFLKDHTLDCERRPYVSPSGMSPDTFQKEHKELYDRAVMRISISDSTRDKLVTYLCSEYAGYLCAQAGQVYGRLQRLEDVMDFILYKYNKSLNNDFL